MWKVKDIDGTWYVIPRDIDGLIQRLKDNGFEVEDLT